MQSANQILAGMNVQANGSKGKFENETQSNEVMDEIWRTMTSLYASKWQQTVSDQAAWRVALKGITPGMIGKGMDKMVANNLDWPPSAMAFRSLCLPTPEDYNLLTESESFQQAIGNSTGKAPETIYTLRAMGSQSFEMRRAVTAEAQKIWAGWYFKTMEAVSSGVELSASLEIFQQPDAPVSKERAREHLAKIRESLA